MIKPTLKHRIFYFLKPIIPRRIQLWLRRQISHNIKLKNADIWPINYLSANPPSEWKGWPDNKKFAVVLTHDVESVIGHDKSLQLMEVDKRQGFRSSFNFVPEKYTVSEKARQVLVDNGFEVGVHGLNHDGKLFQSREIFTERVKKINKYLGKWNAVGFRAPAMHHNLEWIHELNIEYDLSTFDTDPFEPQPDPMNTIFPFYIYSQERQTGYVEMPYTLPQDFLLFIILREKSPDLWQKKLDWIVENSGMMLINVHPDYVNFDKKKLGIEEFPLNYYEDFLKYINERYEGLFWNALPKELSQFWKSQMTRGKS